MNFIKILLFLTLISIVPAQEKSTEISIYKNVNAVDRSYDVIENTFWDFLKEGDLELLTLKTESETAKFNEVFDRLTFLESAEKPFLHPEYAIIFHKEKNDTVFLNVTLDKGYFSGSNKIFIDDDRHILNYLLLKNFLSEHTKSLEKK